MHLGTLRYGRCLGLAALALALTCLPLTACGSSGGGGGGDPTPPPTPQPRLVKAEPAGQTFDPTLDVTLMVEGDDSAGATIYYTTDLSPLFDDDGLPTGNGIEYTGPLTLTTDTVVKFYAEWADATVTDPVWEGYVQAGAGSIKAQIASSGHGEIAAEAWRHWDADDPAEVSGSCAKCHSPGGYLQWAKDQPVTAQPLPFGLLDCTACHEVFPTVYGDLTVYTALEPVEFPSTEEVSLFEPSNICMGCHQGRKWGGDVDDQIAGGAPWSFQNVHYYPAAASFWGAAVNGAYQYFPNDYANRNTFASHPEGYNTCVGCHMGAAAPHDHSFLPDLTLCQSCHGGTSFETLGGSPGANYTTIQGAIQQLLPAIEALAATLPSGPITYNASRYPYWFKNDGSGDRYVFGVDPADDPPGSSYVPTPDDEALFKACYNYQFALKEPCGYVHNALYVRQILHDTLVDLGTTPNDIPPDRSGYMAPPNVFQAKSEEFLLSGHGDVTAEAFRHWDPDYASPSYDPSAPVEVEADCARCHAAWGYINWAEADPAEPVNVLSVVGCVACHKQANLYESGETRYDDVANNPALEPVVFPSLLTATLNGDSNICMGCHQGRSSTVQVDAEIVANPGGPHVWRGFNIHYYAAAASFFGTAVKGGYEYTGNTYNNVRGWFGHAGIGYDNCIGCHLRNKTGETPLNDHSFLPQVTDCTTSGCHSGSSFETLNVGVSDNYSNIQTLLTELYAAIQAYASTLAPPPGGAPTDPAIWIIYAENYPYWFIDTNQNGQVDPGENIFPNAYATMDDALLQACYNYQFGQKDPGGYIHNGDYVIQLLYDSIVGMGGTPSVSRP